MVAHAHAVVCGEHHQGVVRQALFLQPAEDAANARVHGGNSREVAPKVFFPPGGAVHRAGGHVGVIGNVGDALKLAGIVVVDPLLGVMLRPPGGVGRRVMNAQVEGILPLCQLVQEFQRPVGDKVGDVFAVLHGDGAVLHNIRVVVEASGRTRAGG